MKAIGWASRKVAVKEVMKEYDSMTVQSMTILMEHCLVLWRTLLTEKMRANY